MYSGHMFFCLLVLFLLLFRGASSAPSALSVTPSTTWYGDDGSWSAVSIRVGSPQQWVDVLVSTASSETWVVSPYGCDGTSLCKSKRGGLFEFNQSSTWQTEGVFELGLDTQLGFTGDANYGLDTLEFGTTGVSLKSTIIGSINTTDYWVGFFGLGNIPGNFTTTEVSSPVGALENQSLIPSNSYGYTAGAIYQAKSEPCSLTLGGYDANRFVPHNISFELNPVHQPDAFLNSISVASSSSTRKPSNWSDNPLQLLAPADGVYVTIDSSTPFLWLPKSTCEKFAQALSLTYNDSLALYTFDGNASQRDALRSLNLNFTFSLSDTSSPSQIVNITLPYAAFDLQLTYPYIINTTYASGNKYYFPLRQAANETQYVLGRSFLQEAYIITDYDRNNFSIYQALHPADPTGNTSIVDITKPGANSSPGPGGQSTLSQTAIIGIAVGAAALLVLILALLTFYVYRRRKHQRQRHEILVEKKPEYEPSSVLSPNTTKRFPSTVPGTPGTPSTPLPVFEVESLSKLPPTEISADATHERFELEGVMPEELDGRGLSYSAAARAKDGKGVVGGEEGEKFPRQILWERENNSGSKCRPSMRLVVRDRPDTASSSRAPALMEEQGISQPSSRPPSSHRPWVAEQGASRPSSRPPSSHQPWVGELEGSGEWQNEKSGR